MSIFQTRGFSTVSLGVGPKTLHNLIVEASRMDQILTPVNIIKIALFVGGYLIAVAQSHLQSRTGRWILIEKVSETPLFSRPLTMSGRNGIQIRVYDRPIESLLQTCFRIRNTGADITGPVQAKLSLKDQKTGEPAMILGIKAREEYFAWPSIDEVVLERKFFNSSHAYRDELTVLIYSEGPLTLRVAGTGIGWQARYIDLVQRRTTVAQALRSTVFATIGGEKLLARATSSQTENEGEETWLGAA